MFRSTLTRPAGLRLTGLALTALLSIPALTIDAEAQALEIEATSTVHPERLLPPPPVDKSKALAVEALAVLPRADYAAAHEVGALTRWNLERRQQPVQTGFSRTFETPTLVAFGAPFEGQPGAFEMIDGAAVWSARVEVERAHRLRLHLAEADLPTGSELWVRGEGTVVPFGLELRSAEGDLWTPSVGGSSIELVVRLPKGATHGDLRIDSVAEVFRLDEHGAPDFTDKQAKDNHCLEDGACYGNSDLPNYDLYQEAVANLNFMDGGSTFACSGTMVNDVDTTTFVPYLLTANHCFSTQAAASTLEAFFDDIALTCNGDFPDLDTLPRVNGSTLLATSATSDSTFVRLSGNPSGNTAYAGWSTAVVGNGLTLYRLSHPNSWSQHFTVYLSKTPSITCSGVPTLNFIYTQPTLGATAGGSSGGSLVDNQIRIRGQLLGACGPDPNDICNPDNDDVDGRFAIFFDLISGFLTSTGGAGCIGGDTTLCLDENRFQIEGTWRDFTGATGNFHAVPFTDQSGLFWFFDSNNIEMLIKVIDGCSFNNRHWVFFAATTDVEYTVTVTDTQENTSKSYSNALGNPSPAVTDTNAFATCP